MLTTATTEWTSAVEEGLTLCHWNTYKLTISHSHTLALRPSLNRARVWPVTFPQLTPHPKHSVWLPLGICKHLTTFSISSSYYSLHTWPISSRNPQCVITFNKLIMQEWVTIVQHLKDFLGHSVMHFSVSVSNWTCTYNSPTHVFSSVQRSKNVSQINSTQEGLKRVINIKSIYITLAIN